MRINNNGKIFDYKDIDDENFSEILKECGPNCMSSVIGWFEVMYALYNNVKYIVGNSIPGDIVECGVWKGGMMQLAALTLLSLGDKSRKIYLYDTFEGMPEPGEKDINWDGVSAKSTWEKYQKNGEKWGDGGNLSEVTKTMISTNYPRDNLIFVKGMVEDTIPDHMPESISILRLDTDLYSSTLHELENLYPRLIEGGVLVIDDYGYYLGAREATDKYFRENKIRFLLSRVSPSVREGVKQLS